MPAWLPAGVTQAGLEASGAMLIGTATNDGVLNAAVCAGPRAVAIITQLSVLFGILFVISGNDLWPVIFCHGLYDTIAFVRFANKQSKYSNLENL